MILKTFTFLATLAASVIAFTATAEAQFGGRIEFVQCEPATCSNNLGPTRGGSVQTRIWGRCSLSFPEDPDLTLTARLEILQPCSTYVLLETEASSGNYEYLDDWGCPFMQGQLDGHAKVIDVIRNITLYSAGRYVDCDGGASPPPPPFSSC